MQHWMDTAASESLCDLLRRPMSVLHGLVAYYQQYAGGKQPNDLH